MTEQGFPISAGHFSRQMAVPWQADFAACALVQSHQMLFGWWPAQRPDSVFPDEKTATQNTGKLPWSRATKVWPEEGGAAPTGNEMVKHWFEFGFVVRKELDATVRPPTDVFFETEREKSVPSP